MCYKIIYSTKILPLLIRIRYQCSPNSQYSITNLWYDPIKQFYPMNFNPLLGYNTSIYIRLHTNIITNTLPRCSASFSFLPLIFQPSIINFEIHLYTSENHYLIYIHIPIVPTPPVLLHSFFIQ